MAYTLHHPSAEPDAIRGLVESLRRSAIDLGFWRVGDVVSLIGDGEIISSDFGERFLVSDLEIVPAVPRSVIYFTGALFDSDLVEIGLAYNPCEVEVGGHVVPFGLPYWTWTGATRTRDLRTFSKLLYHAAEIGIESFMSFAGVTMVYSKDDAGGVRIEQEWDEIPDDF